MDSTAIIGGLVAAIMGMAGLFTFLMKDERQRVKDLLARLDEQNKLVLNAVDVLGKAVETVHGKSQLYEVIGKVNEVKDTLGGVKSLYEAIEKVHQAEEAFERLSQQAKRPQGRTGGGINETR